MSTQQGRAAEQAAAMYLQRQGYKIVMQNWRTRWCEIDIVASLRQQLYFIEAKYRRTAQQGYGLDYITPKKLRQMQFAAAFWMVTHKLSTDYQLAAIELTGQPPEVTTWLDDVG